MASNDDKKEHLLDNEVPLPNQNDISYDNVNSPMQAVAGVMGNVLEWYVSTIFSNWYALCLEFAQYLLSTTLELT